MPLLQPLIAALHELEWLGAFLSRLVVGLLFLLSGYGKLFQPSLREEMRRTVATSGVPFPRFTAPAVSGVEFVFGGLLLLGALNALTCLMLSADMGVAILTNRVRTIHASSVRLWLSAFLYLPEVLYLVILLWLLFTGPGWLSVDHWLFASATL